MSIATAKLTPGHDYSSGDTVTDVNLDALGNPTVKLGPTGDPDTGMGNPSADNLTLETGGTERIRVSSDGFRIGSTGGDIEAWWLASFTLPSSVTISANSRYNVTFTHTISGARTSDAVILTPMGDYSGVIVQGYVSGSNTISFVIINGTSSDVSGTFGHRYIVLSMV